MPHTKSYNTFPPREDGEYPMAAPYCLIGDPTGGTNGRNMVDLGQIPGAVVSLSPSGATASDVGGHQRAENRVDRGIMGEITVTLNDLQAAVMETVLTAATPNITSDAVQSVDTTNDTVTVSGDATGDVIEGQIIEITGSTGNDGEYEVDSLTYDSTADETTFTLASSLTDTTADGDVEYANGAVNFRTDVRVVESPTLCLVPSEAYRDLEVDGTAVIDNEGVWWAPAVRESSFGDLTYEDTEGEDANPDIDVTFQPLLTKTDLSGASLPQGARKIFRGSPNQFSGLSWSLPTRYQP